MGGDDDKGPKIEPRTKWLLERVNTVFGFAAAKFDKFCSLVLADEGSSRSIDRFLNDAETAFIFFYPTSGDVVTAVASELPTVAQLKKKVVCAHRVNAESDFSTDAKVLADQVIIMELSKHIMDTLNNYCHSIYLSTLSNPANQRGWSDLISKDLMDKYHVFLANLHVTAGLMKGKTLLPLPPKEATPDASNVSKDRVHVLEGAVITWTKQIRHVLKQEPEAAFKDPDMNPEPMVEIDFWKHKAANLNSIHSSCKWKD
jgi:dynein heavy chain